INKKLSLISNKNTILKGTTTNIPGESYSSVIYFGKGSVGSLLQGFNIQGREVGVSITNTYQITIKSNTISQSSITGVKITNSDKITLERNSISENIGSGIILTKSNNTKIISNQIKSNHENGLFIENIINTNISKNNIESNYFSGIKMSEITKNLYITLNNISKSSRGILIDSKTINVQILSNNLRYNNLEYPDHDYGDTGCGIAFTPKFIDDYKAGIYPIMKGNGFYGNKGHSIMAPMNIGNFLLQTTGNWYGSNDIKESHLCHHIKSDPYQAKIEKITNGFKIAFYDGDKIATDLAPMTVSVYINGKEYIVTTENGEAKITLPENENNGVNFFDFRVDGFKQTKVQIGKEASHSNQNNEGNGNGGSGSGNGNGQGTSGNGFGNTQGNESGIAGSGENTLTPKYGDNEEGSQSAEDSNSPSKQKQNAKEIVINEPNTGIFEDKTLVYLVVPILIAIIAGSFLLRRFKKE
ncbi:MAG: right-handed parallel beta-helix repeat-containing protein, partial [Methanobrevibacter sp.]|nr:right-handed parallel beta-helix repeat-containing protein [Methanobrevibacter sp.]